MTLVPDLPNLVALREKGGISLQQIAATTKIRVHYLEVIERGQFAKLPGGIYNTSYIRQYARAIGFPEDALLAVYFGTPRARLQGLSASAYGSD